MQTKTEVYRRRLRFQCMIFCALLLVGCAGIHVLGMLTPDGNGAAYGLSLIHIWKLAGESNKF